MDNGEDKMDKKEQSSKFPTLKAFLAGLGIGGLVGTVLALLYAPQSGKETRETIKDKKNEFLKYGAGFVDKSKEYINKGKEMISSTAENIVTSVQEGLKAAKEKKDEILKSFDKKEPPAEKS